MQQRLWWFLLVAVGCGSVSDKAADAPPAPGEDACVPETDAELCAAASRCEMHAVTDRCGAQRSLDCGDCTSGQGCVAGTCRTPVCSSFTYTPTTITTFSRTGSEDSITAATPDLSTIVYNESPVNSCGGFAFVLADETAPNSGSYTKQNISVLVRDAGLHTGEDNAALTADGLTIISRTTDGKRFAQITRSARGLIDFGTAVATPYQAINDQLLTFGANAQLAAPVISSDGLQFLYSVIGASTPANNGIYSAERASATAAFPAGTKLPAPATDYPSATGISSDRLTLFVFHNFAGRVLTRTSTTKPFVNPNAPADPPQIGAWQLKPSSDCARLIAVYSPGGCLNEDVVLMTRQ